MNGSGINPLVSDVLPKVGGRLKLSVGAGATVSVGVGTCTPGPGMSSTVLFDAALRALEAARSEGRNRVALRDAAG